MNVEKAREHLELARQELGIEEFPPLMMLAGDTPIGLLSAEYYQQLFRNTWDWNFGLMCRF